MWKKTILFSITYYKPYVSGLTICVQRYAEKFTGQVVCIKHDQNLKDREEIGGVEVYRAKPLVKISKGWLSWEWPGLTKNLVREADVVVVNLPQFEGFIPAIWAKLGEKRLVVIYHCEVETDNWLVKKALGLGNWISLKLADKIIVYTRDYAINSPELKPFLYKTEEIYPPIPDVIPGKINVGGDYDYLVGMAARLAKEKGVEYLIEAIPEIEKGLNSKKIKIVIAGPTDPVGEEKYKQKILTLVRKYSSRVELLGTLNEKEMAAFYKTIDVLAVPSVDKTEAFGMVQVEAMKQGTPVVASDLPGVRVPIQKTGMGKLVAPKNSHELALAIVEVLKNKERYRSFLEDPKIIFSAEDSYAKYRSVFYS